MDLQVAACPDWSMEREHDAHEWDAPVDGHVKCPGWGQPDERPGVKQPGETPQSGGILPEGVRVEESGGDVALANRPAVLAKVTWWDGGKPLTAKLGTFPVSEDGSHLLAIEAAAKEWRRDHPQAAEMTLRLVECEIEVGPEFDVDDDRAEKVRLVPVDESQDVWREAAPPGRAGVASR